MTSKAINTPIVAEELCRTEIKGPIQSTNKWITTVLSQLMVRQFFNGCSAELNELIPVIKYQNQ